MKSKNPLFSLRCLLSLWLILLSNKILSSPPFIVPIETVAIYGYNATRIMASVVNANTSQVAFTSFECTDKGYWTYAGSPQGSITDPGRTGNRYYNLSYGNITRSAMPSATYVVSYWANGPASLSGAYFVSVKTITGPTINGWTNYQTTFGITQANGSITLSGNIKIDELRLHPPQAQMVSYTYDPLIGLTSETDINNNSTYYQYDEFNRLKCIRDTNYVIRKTYSYGIKAAN